MQEDGDEEEERVYVYDGTFNGEGRTGKIECMAVPVDNVLVPTKSFPGGCEFKTTGWSEMLKHVLDVHVRSGHYCDQGLMTSLKQKALSVS